MGSIAARGRHTSRRIRHRSTAGSDGLRAAAIGRPPRPSIRHQQLGDQPHELREAQDRKAEGRSERDGKYQ